MSSFFNIYVFADGTIPIIFSIYLQPQKIFSSDFFTKPATFSRDFFVICTTFSRDFFIIYAIFSNDFLKFNENSTFFRREIKVNNQRTVADKKLQ